MCTHSESRIALKKSTSQSILLFLICDNNKDKKGECWFMKAMSQEKMRQTVGGKKYTCEYCGKVCKTYVTYGWHLLYHLGRGDV